MERHLTYKYCQSRLAPTAGKHLNGNHQRTAREIWNNLSIQNINLTHELTRVFIRKVRRLSSLKTFTNLKDTS